MIVPPIGKEVEAEKLNVIGTPVRLAIRSLEAIENETNVTCVNIPPLLTATLGSVSADVSKYTLTLAAVTPPMTKPEIVTVNAEAAGMEAPAVVITREVAVVALHVPVKLTMLLIPAVIVGVVGAKKAVGYVSVIVLPGLSNVEGVKPSVAGTLDFAAIRSDDVNENVTAVTCPIMVPDGTGSEISVSAELLR